MSKFQKIGWSAFSIRERLTDITSSIKAHSKRTGKDAIPFTPPSEAGGNQRARLINPYVEHKQFFDEILSGERRQATVINFCMILRHQLMIELSGRTAFSSPSKTSIINDCGQYFYREVFTKLFSPITRGYKIDEMISRTSIYSFFLYTKWLYSFINHRYMKKDREKLLEILKEALGSIHDLFMQLMNVSTTSIYYSSRSDSPSEKLSGESGVLDSFKNVPTALQVALNDRCLI